MSHFCGILRGLHIRWVRMIKKLGKKDEQEVAKTEEKEMSFLEHLEELRWHIVRSILSVVIIAIVVFLFKDAVTRIMYAPRYSSFFTHRLICDFFGFHCDVAQFKMIRRELGEDFFVHLKTSLSLGIILSFPYIFWEIWRFIKPGLYEKERKAARGMVGVCSLLFFIGVLFGYFIIAPFAINFLANYSFGNLGDEKTVNLSSYVGYLTMLTLPVGFVFELPVLSYVLAKIGVLTSGFMKNYRRHAIVIIFIVGAVISPPDLASQLLIAFPLMGLYELSISIVKRIEKKNKVED